MSPELIDWTWRALIALAIGLILYAVKDRRKAKVENELAEETLEPKAHKVGIEALESQILAMSGAWNQERDSKDRQINELKQELSETKGKLEKAEGTIVELRDQARHMQEQLEDFQRQLRRFQSKLDQTQPNGRMA